MPMQRERYPDDWEAIALAVKEAADWCCVECGRRCFRPGELTKSPTDQLAVFARNAAHLGLPDDAEAHRLKRALLLGEVMAKPMSYVLTVAHTPDPDPQNCSADNLKALCSVCHCRLDAGLKGMRRRGVEDHPELPGMEAEAR